MRFESEGVLGMIGDKNEDGDFDGATRTQEDWAICYLVT